MGWRAITPFSASVLMAWVCVSLTLARFSTPKDADGSNGGVAGRHREFDYGFKASDSVDTPTSKTLFVPPWKNLKDQYNSRTGGREPSHVNQPLYYYCGNESVTFRVSKTRYSAIGWKVGKQLKRLTSLPARCHNHTDSLTNEPWLLFPYTGCNFTQWTLDGVKYNAVDLQFFDRLLKKNVTSTAICKSPISSPDSGLRVLPQVTCGRREITVKLPVGSVLKKVQVLAPEAMLHAEQGYFVTHRKTDDALIVKISISKKPTTGGLELGVM